VRFPIAFPATELAPGEEVTVSSPPMIACQPTRLVVNVADSKKYDGPMVEGESREVGAEDDVVAKVLLLDVAFGNRVLKLDGLRSDADRRVKVFLAILARSDAALWRSSRSFSRDPRARRSPEGAAPASMDGDATTIPTRIAGCATIVREASPLNPLLLLALVGLGGYVLLSSSSAQASMALPGATRGAAGGSPLAGPPIGGVVTLPPATPAAAPLTRADYQQQGLALGLSQAQIWDAWDLGLTPEEYAQGMPSYTPQYTGL
jgi:hypothetical protein